MLAAALLVVVAAMLLVRMGWGGRHGVAWAGWALIAGALAVLVARDGAWGLATGTVAGIGAALAIVAHAGWTAPARARRAPREAPSIALPRRPGDLARRCAVFLLVVPLSFAAAQWLAYGAQALARRAGAGEADAIVLALFLQPCIWAALMTWQMTRRDATDMILPPASAALLGTLMWSGS